MSWCCRDIFLPSDQLLAQLDVGRSRFSWPGPDSISSTLLSDQNQVPSPQRPLLWSSRLQCRDLGGRKFSVNSANSVNSDIHLRDICPSDWGEGFNSSTLWRHHIHMGWHFYPKIWPISPTRSNITPCYMMHEVNPSVILSILVCKWIWTRVIQDMQALVCWFLIWIAGAAYLNSISWCFHLKACQIKMGLEES